MECELKFTIKIDDKIIELDENQLRQLYYKLDSVFKINKIEYPVYPEWPRDDFDPWPKITYF